MEKSLTVRLSRFAAAAALLSFAALGVNAAEPNGQLLVTWEAANFFPSDFQGRAFPTDGGKFTVAVETLRRGALLDTSRATILWYLDNQLVARGPGLKESLFTVTKRAGDTHSVRVVVQLQNETPLEAVVPVTIGERQLVIRGITRGTALAPGATASLEAFPYFFNISSLSDLTFFWSIDGIRQSGVSGNLVSLTAPSGAGAFEVGLAVQGRKNPYEYAETKIAVPLRQ